jgi:hypothetical protein
MQHRLLVTKASSLALLALAGCFRPAMFNDRPLFAPDVGRIVVIERDSVLIDERGLFSRYRLVPVSSQDAIQQHG